MKRTAETKLQQWKKNPGRKPLLLKGVRQSGKTYLLKHLFADSFPNSHYIDLKMNKVANSIFSSGNLDPQYLLQELEFALGTTIDIYSELLILDEIQACPMAITALKYFCELKPGAYIAAAGSLLGVHLSEEPFPVGKVDILYLNPLDFREFLEAMGEHRLLQKLNEAHPQKPLSAIVHRRLWQLFGNYLAIGGMPEAIATYTRPLFQSSVMSFFRKMNL